MNPTDRDALVDRITRLVLAELTGQAPAASTHASARGGGGGGGAVAAGPGTAGHALHAYAHDQRLTSGMPGCDRCDAWGPCPDHCGVHVESALAAGATRVSSGLGYCPPDPSGLRGRIDHTLLKPEASADEIRRLCAEAAENCFASVCINPTYVALCAELLRDSSVKVCTVVGFPLGAHLPEVKAYETRRAIQDGAREIDMVINIGALKSRDHALVERDIRAVVDACGPHVVSKVILEMTLLTTEEKIAGCSLAKAAGADFVKTSTGFAKGGATLEDVKLMREVVGPDMGIKAAGGIRTQDDARAMIEAGATRLGTSASIKIVRGEKAEGAY
jgi:deoxyribose-phosphate aldolase